MEVDSSSELSDSSVVSAVEVLSLHCDGGSGVSSGSGGMGLRERCWRRKRSAGSMLGVNKPITKADFAAPQLCVNRKVGGMRRNWSFLSLCGGDESMARMRKQSLLRSAEASWKKDTILPLPFDPILSEQEDV